MSDTQVVIESGLEEGAHVLRNASQYEKPPSKRGNSDPGDAWPLL